MNGKGIVIGIITWLLIINISADSMECLKSKNCGSDDFLMFAAVSVGLLAPASIAAMLGSILFKNKE